MDDCECEDDYDDEDDEFDEDEREEEDEDDDEDDDDDDDDYLPMDSMFERIQSENATLTQLITDHARIWVSVLETQQQATRIFSHRLVKPTRGPEDELAQVAREVHESKCRSISATIDQWQRLLRYCERRIRDLLYRYPLPDPLPAVVMRPRTLAYITAVSDCRDKARTTCIISLHVLAPLLPRDVARYLVRGWIWGTRFEE